MLAPALWQVPKLNKEMIVSKNSQAIEDIEAIVPSPGGPIRVSDRDIDLEPFSTFKALETGKIIGKIIERGEIDQAIADIVNEAGAATLTDLFFALIRSVPKLMSSAPDLLLEFAALAITSNAELEAAYSESGMPSVRKKVEENRRFLSFKTKGGDLPRIINAFVPYVGLDALKKEFTGMIQAVVRELTTQDQSPGSEDSTKSS